MGFLSAADRGFPPSSRLTRGSPLPLTPEAPRRVSPGGLPSFRLMYLPSTSILQHWWLNRHVCTHSRAWESPRIESSPEMSFFVGSDVLFKELIWFVWSISFSNKREVTFYIIILKLLDFNLIVWQIQITKLCFLALIYCIKLHCKWRFYLYTFSFVWKKRLKLECERWRKTKVRILIHHVLKDILPFLILK